MSAPRAAWDAAQAQLLIEAHAQGQGSMLPILHELQTRYGYIDPEAASLIAGALNLSKAETLGVISFYRDFKDRPAKGVVLQLCRAESCQAAGCEDLVEHLSTQHAIRLDSPDQRISIETVYCLGHCAASPAALVDGSPVARLDKQKLDEIISGLSPRTS